MAKRFTDSEKWKDEWFLSLTNDHKIIWFWILDNCDHAGILKKGVRNMNFQCGTSISEEELLSIFKDRIILHQDQIYFIPKFLKFQYPKGINENSAIFSSIRKILIDKGLCDLVRDFLGKNFITDT